MKKLLFLFLTIFSVTSFAQSNGNVRMSIYSGSLYNTGTWTGTGLPYISSSTIPAVKSISGTGSILAESTLRVYDGTLRISRVTSYLGGVASWPQGKMFYDGTGNTRRLNIGYFLSNITVGTTSGGLWFTDLLPSSDSWSSPTCKIQHISNLTLNQQNIGTYAVGADENNKWWTVLYRTTSSGTSTENLVMSSTNRGTTWNTEATVDLTGQNMAENETLWSTLNFVNDGTNTWITVGFRDSTGTGEGRCGILRIRRDSPSIQQWYDIISAAEASSNGWTGSNRYTEPQIYWDATAGKLVGWLRHNASSNNRPFWFSSSDFGQTYTKNRLAVDFAGWGSAGPFAVPIPVVRYGNYYYSLMNQRYAPRSIWAMRGAVSDVGSGSITGWEAINIGKSPGRDVSSSYVSSDPTGNAAAVVDGSLVSFAFGVYEPTGDDRAQDCRANVWKIDLDFSSTTNPFVEPANFGASALPAPCYQIEVSTLPNYIIALPNMRYINTGTVSREIIAPGITSGKIGDKIEMINCSSGTIIYSANASVTTITLANGSVLTGGSYRKLEQYGASRWQTLVKMSQTSTTAANWYAQNPFVANNTNNNNYPTFALQSGGRFVVSFNSVDGFSADASGIRPLAGAGFIGQFGAVRTTQDFTSVASGTTVTITGIACTGANTSSGAHAAFVRPMFVEGLIITAASVSSGTVSLTAYNPTALPIDPASTTFDIVTMGKD